MVLQAKSANKWTAVATTTINAHAGRDSYQLAGRWHGQLLSARDLRLLVQVRQNGQWVTGAAFSLTVIN
jgi:hypothetical protein